MSAYAAGTSVSAQRTTGEIMGLLEGRGVVKVATFSEPRKHVIAFEYDGVPYRISLPLPLPDDPQFIKTPSGSIRSATSQKETYQKEINRLWRAFGMVIKAKIVAVEEGISTMEAEFIGNAIMKNGQTVAETYAPQLKQLAALGHMPMLALPGGSS